MSTRKKKTHNCMPSIRTGFVYVCVMYNATGIDQMPFFCKKKLTFYFRLHLFYEMPHCKSSLLLLWILLFTSVVLFHFVQVSGYFACLCIFVSICLFLNKFRYEPVLAFGPKHLNWFYFICNACISFVRPQFDWSTVLQVKLGIWLPRFQVNSINRFQIARIFGIAYLFWVRLICKYEKHSNYLIQHTNKSCRLFRNSLSIPSPCTSRSKCLSLFHTVPMNVSHFSLECLAAQLMAAQKFWLI